VCLKEDRAQFVVQFIIKNRVSRLNTAMFDRIKDPSRIFLTCEITSGSVDGASRAWWHADDVVPVELLGRADGRLHHESASSKHVGISHGLSLGANATPALSGIFLQSTESSQKHEIQ